MSGLALSVPLPACGPDIPQPAFWFSNSPDDPERFFGGEIGVLGRELDPIYLYVAYRHVVGLGLDEESRTNLERFSRLPPPNPWRYDAVRLWEEAVAEVTGRRRSLGGLPVQVPLTGPDGEWAGFFINCLEDAFRKAAKTLRARAARYGPEAPELSSWIEAQEMVFSNCGATPGRIPQPLPPSSDQLARADREYQIAAAAFYARDFDRAGASFGEIAANRESPWSDLGAYLQARCLIRSASVGFLPRQQEFTRAKGVLESILADSARQSVHDMSRRLLQYVEIRLDPVAVRRTLGEQLSARRLGPDVGQDLVDYFWLLSRTPVDDIESSRGLDRWLHAFRDHHDPDAGKLAAETFEALTGAESMGGSEPPHLASTVGSAEAQLWLAASLVLTPGVKPWTAAILEAARDVRSDSPVFPTVRYHVARLQKASRAYAEAREGLDEALGLIGDRLSPGDRSRFSILRAELAPRLEERIALGQQIPVAFTGEHQGSGDHRLEGGSAYVRQFVETPLAADVAVDALNVASSERLARLLADGPLHPTLARRLAPIAWTRAVLLGEESVAMSLEEVVTAAAPELATELERYRSAAPGDERLFAGALTVLRFPGLRPTLRHGFGRYGVGSYWADDAPGDLSDVSILRDNWWCADPLHGIHRMSLAILENGDRAEAERSIARLRYLPPAPTHLGHIVLGWAETHREDPRLPEALHRVVAASRLCGGGEISRVAFQTLHRRYPDSPWARKTRYWYR